MLALFTETEVRSCHLSCPKNSLSIRRSGYTIQGAKRHSDSANPKTPKPPARNKFKPSAPVFELTLEVTVAPLNSPPFNVPLFTQGMTMLGRL